MYYLGIDGGGTNSRLMAEGTDGQVFGPYFGGSTNISSNAAQVVWDNLRVLLNQFFAEQSVSPENVRALVIGSAGVDLPGDAREMEDLLRDLGLTGPVLAVNDVEIVLASETKGGPGVVVISGTGSVALGKNQQNQIWRTGGWGHLLGDEGSGYWIGKQAIAHCLQSFDGRGEETALSEMICNAWGIERIDKILPLVYSHQTNKSRIAGISRLVDQAASIGDPVALHLMDQAARQLFDHALVIVKKLEMTGNFPIILSGGTVCNSQMLWEKLSVLLKELSPVVIRTEKSPCEGALYLAQKLYQSKPSR